MKKIAAVLLLLVFATPSFADEYVNGYYRKDGTYVKPYVRSTQNRNKYDNYGSSSRSQSYNSPYTRDSDGDGLYNQFDMDDNNNGVFDDNE